MPEIDHETHAASKTAAALPPAPAGYEILGIAGRGGMARVYRARHLKLGRTVALKMLPRDAEESLTARFIEEARSAARLQHPQVAAIFEVGDDEQQPFFAMEYANGGTLAQRLAGRPQPPREAVALVAGLARAVQHCHDHGIIHRDLKPANVLLVEEGDNVAYKISDFGLAKRLDDDKGLTKTGEIMGTPAYMAPEQASGVFKEVGPAADVYSLGAMLYECLTGRPPFDGTDAMDIVLQVLADEPLRPRQLQPTLPRDLETICLKCLEKSPRRRYATALDLAEDLERWLSGEPIKARPAGITERVWKWARRRPWQATALAAGVLLLIGSVTAAVLLDARARQTAKARDDAEQHAQRLFNTLERLSFNLSGRVRELPRGETLFLEILDETDKMLSEMATFKPNDPRVQGSQAESRFRLGEMESDVGRQEKARAAYQESIRLFDILLRKLPTSRHYRASRGQAVMGLAMVSRRDGKSVEAAKLEDEAFTIADELMAEPAENSRNEKNVLSLFSMVARIRARAAVERQDPKMQEYLQKSVDAHRRLAAAIPDDSQARIQTLSAELLAAAVQVLNSDFVGAEKTLRQAKESSPPQPGELQAVVRLRSLVLKELARIYHKGSDYTAAEAEYKAAVEILRKLSTDSPDILTIRLELARTQTELADTLRLAGKEVESREGFKEAESIVRELLVREPANKDFLAQLEYIEKLKAQNGTRR
ncbi:MAG: serine/threonine-protein kinase [Pirellulaceae bacterium]